MTLETEEGDELAVDSPVVLSDQDAALLEELLKFYDLLADPPRTTRRAKHEHPGTHHS